MINPAIIDAENHGSVNSYFKLYQMKNYFVRTNLTLRKVTNIYISIAFIINLTLFFLQLLAYTIAACIAIGVCLLSFSFTVYGTYLCANWKNKYGQLLLMCGTNYDVQIVMHVSACLLSFFLIFFLIYGIVLYFVYKDVYQFFDWEIGYHNEYFYTVPTETRIIDNNPRYAISDRSPIVEKVHYVSAEKSYAIEENKYKLKQNDDMQPADIVSEYNTSNHKYLVLRFDRNQIRPI